MNQSVTSTVPASPVGLHRVLEPSGAAVTLPQAARRLDARREIWPSEVRIAIDTLNLDAASYRQLAEKHRGVDGEVDGGAVREEVLAIVAERGKMQNPVTGSGGMLIGTVDEVGPDSPLGLTVGDRVATLVSLSLTPLTITDGLRRWDGRSEQVPAAGHAVLFERSIAGLHRSISTVMSSERRHPGRPRPAPLAHGHGRLRRACARVPRGGGVCRSPRRRHRCR